MPKTNPNFNDPEFQKFLQQIKIIGQTESGNNYASKNPTPGQTATGKYQYNQSHLPEIKKYSREIGMPVDTLEQFRNSPGLQEAYFQYDQYKAYEWAKKKVATDNPFDYNMAELAALRHFQGEAGANKILSTGKHKESDNIGNPSTKEYIEKRFRPALKQSGLYTPSGAEKNSAKANSLDAKEKEKIQQQYFAERKKIKDQKLSSIVENGLMNDLNQKYFDSGNLEIVNRKIDYRNNNANYKEETAAINSSADLFFQKRVQKGYQRPSNEYYENEDTKKSIAAIAKQFGEDPNKIIAKSDAPAYGKGKYNYIDPKSKTGQYLIARGKGGAKAIDELMPKLLPKKETYSRIDLNQYERLVDPNDADWEDVDMSTADTSTESTEQTAASSALLNPQAPPVTEQPEPEAFSNAEVMNMFDGGLFQDEQFQYNPGGPNIPWESVGYLLAGLEGVEAGNVGVPERDEEISPALRNYAAELKKISQMGLPPEIEGDLKSKLAQAYQTGITNLVRASGGNRNLVLGNQGQLDLARMQGITDIALMDIDRRDKALAAYGEVVQYMDSFYANRDIANNERQYREVEKKQMAGSALAQQSFGALIESLKYAKENGPGSANDMYRQYMMYSISGINPSIDDDGSGTVPGTTSYANAQRDLQAAQKNEKQKMKSFYNSQSKEDKQKFNTFLKENDHLRPDVNRELTFDELKSEFDAYAGNTEAKDVIADKQGTISESGIISLSEDQLNNPEKYYPVTPMPELNAYGPQEPAAAAQNNYAPAVYTDNNMALQQITQPNTVDTTKTPEERFRTANAALEQYLMDQNKKTNDNLDSLIQATEEQTKKMESQLKQTY